VTVDLCVGIAIGWGRDLINGVESVQGSRFNDVLRTSSIHTRDNLAYGIQGDDQLIGGPERDVLVGGMGDDRVRGNEEQDLLIGGSGADQLWGGPDDDWLEGRSGGDHLYGGYGHDTLQGGKGDDSLNGGAGQDVCDEAGTSCEPG
jgi:Ca2+-binding RTX toxin-like protein